MSRLRTLTLGLVAMLAILATPALAATPQATMPDLEDEIMCPICGTLLELAESPQAERQRVLIYKLIDEGKSKDEIKDALIAEYGREVIAMPESKGFQLSAYVVPIIAFVVAAIALAIGVRRWRRASRNDGDGDGPRSRPAGPSGEDAARLDADLARYDL